MLLHSIKARLGIFAFALICCFQMQAQTDITDAAATTYNTASEGDMYRALPSGQLYVGLSDGSLRNINKDLEELLSFGNDANGALIKNLGTPIDNNDAATKTYVDQAITYQHVSINEYLAEELVLARDGQIIYVIPDELDGMEIQKIRASVYTTGTGGGNTQVALRHRQGSTESTVVTVSVASGNYTGQATVGGSVTVSAGDILRLNTTQVTNNEPEGLTCTITFSN